MIAELRHCSIDTHTLNTEQFNCNENKRLFTFIARKRAFCGLFLSSKLARNQSMEMWLSFGMMVLRQKGPGNGFNAPVIKDFCLMNKKIFVCLLLFIRQMVSICVAI